MAQFNCTGEKEKKWERDIDNGNAFYSDMIQMDFLETKDDKTLRQLI